MQPKHKRETATGDGAREAREEERGLGALEQAAHLPRGVPQVEPDPGHALPGPSHLLRHEGHRGRDNALTVPMASKLIDVTM